MAVFSVSPAQFISSIPPATRAYTAATIAFSLLYYVLELVSGTEFAAPYLVLIPGSSAFYPWTLLTSALVETTVVELIFTLICIPASLRYLERLWGATELLKFIAVTITVSNIIAFGLNWIEYVVLRNPVFLYGQQYHGQMALQIGVLVAFRQIIPEHQVQLFGVLKARVKTLPMAYVTFSTVMCIVGFQCPFIVIQFGWLVSYIWLRFYKKNTGDLGGGPLYGDRSETFAFITWFPPLLHGPLTLLGDTAFTLATRFHLIPISGSDVESGGYSQVPGGARAEAERRRAMALKALDQRLAGGATSPTPPQRTANSSSAPSRPAAASISRTTETSLPKKTPSTTDVTQSVDAAVKDDKEN
ncbi:uncharacterized protein FIBRA_05259 [Fibroporia radiculosa]|uniref:Eukaryotic integral membrane protein n=1 Tax=Fibroporia radiculosa TaxID=599839 RepID=J4G8X7_9APHY|nr:uncharacterized protein FIBRA_05259 [Fibroporia radiculosa]CCM03138.1 predicted protein [Fibroporia radiculosa]